MTDADYVDYATLRTTLIMGLLASGVFGLWAAYEYMAAGMGLITVSETPSGSIMFSDGQASLAYVLAAGAATVVLLTAFIMLHSGLRVLDEHHPAAELPSGGKR